MAPHGATLAVMVIVDTSVWIRTFRPGDSAERRTVDRLVAQGQAAMVGPVLAEALRGARSPQEFRELEVRLAALPYLADTQGTWVRVGALGFQLLRKGVTVPMVDVVIAALALEHDCEVYTTDQHFQRIPGLKLYEAAPS